MIYDVDPDDWVNDEVTDLHLPDMACCDEDDAKDRWRECRECGCPIGDTDELCRSLTCHLYGKKALAPLTNARSASTKGALITAHMSSGTFDAEFWDRLLATQVSPDDLLGPITLEPSDDVNERKREEKD